MKLTLTRIQKLFAVLAALVLYNVRTGTAQVETIEPNPTQPFDIDTDFPYSSKHGGARFGRGPTRPGQPREQNPAETMLREIEGTNYGHHTGHALLTPRRVGQPENRWRCRFYRGRWWYWTPERRWSYFDGRHWMPYTPP
jgi:hypothetical protein